MFKQYNKNCFFINFFLMGSLCGVSPCIVQSQNMINNGNSIVVSQGANLVITGNYVNLNSGADGKLDLDGKMIVQGNIVNNANNNILVNIEPVPDGEVLMNGTTPQSIEGISPTHFENLTIENSAKTLNISLCQVNGNINIDAPLLLNAKRIILNNSNPTALNYLSNYILSETKPSQGYGELQWNIGNTLGTYNVPFGTSNAANDLNVTLTTKSTSNPFDGNIVFATYPTDDNLNNPFPIGVNDLSNIDPLSIADRFWLVDAQYLQKPLVDIKFRFKNPEDIDNNIKIQLRFLKGMRYNPVIGTWGDWGPFGISDTVFNEVSISDVSPENFFPNWTLVSTEESSGVWIPNSFTPDGNGVNDTYKPVTLGFEPVKYTMMIYNRWGEELFHSNDISMGWDGKSKGTSVKAPLGVYVWIIIATNYIGKEYRYEGKVTLVR